jgi:abortive infection bacteriophage resistance protein
MHKTFIHLHGLYLPKKKFPMSTFCLEMNNRITTVKRNISWSIGKDSFPIAYLNHIALTGAMCVNIQAQVKYFSKYKLL